MKHILLTSIYNDKFSLSILPKVTVQSSWFAYKLSVLCDSTRLLNYIKENFDDVEISLNTTGISSDGDEFNISVRDDWIYDVNFSYIGFEKFKPIDFVRMKIFKEFTCLFEKKPKVIAK